MPVKTFAEYKNWRPVFNQVIKDESLAAAIYEKGYAVIPFLNQSQVNEITRLYNKEHTLDIKNGGMFYSLYSKDLAYRKRIHDGIGKILEPLLKERFSNYRNIVNTFITKASGPESEFYVHQDTTALDEFRYSPLSVWIPLQDITPENGALGVIEKTHWFFSPYRGISFPPPFRNINGTLREYLKPVYLKAGEAIVFDPRIVHHSMPNISGHDRLVALCGIFPEEAEFIACFKDPKKEKIELLKQGDEYILENESFFYDCHSRPKTGKVIGEIENDFPEMNSETFEKLCELNEIPKMDLIGENQNVNCQFIAEPDGINRVEEMHCETKEEKSIWQKVKEVFN